METKVQKIPNIQTTLYAEELGAAVIIWTMEVETRPNPDYQKKDWWEPEELETRSVAGIQLIELVLFDKVGVNITAHIVTNPHACDLLKRKLIAAVIDKEIDELQGKEVVL